MTQDVNLEVGTLRLHILDGFLVRCLSHETEATKKYTQRNAEDGA